MPPELIALDPMDFHDPNATVSVLGCLKFSVDASPIAGAITKRNILSKIACIFDPMGWLAPVVITAKILMQSLWLLRVGWDDTLPDEFVSRWLLWQSELALLKEVTVPC